MAKHYLKEAALYTQPKYAADPLTHEAAKQFYKKRGHKLKTVVDQLLLWNMDRIEREEKRRAHSPPWKVREMMPVGLAIPRTDDE